MIEKITKLDVYEYFKRELEEYPFIIIIGKYDQIIGPRALHNYNPFA